MDIASFFTPQTSSVAQNQNTPQTGGLVSGGLPQGLNFFDLILARLGENKPGENKDTTVMPEQNNEGNILQSNTPLLGELPGKNPDLNLAKILAENPDIKEQVQDFIKSAGLGSGADLAQILELNQHAFDNVLKPLTDGIITSEEIANGSPRILQAFLVNSSNTQEDGEAVALQLSQLKQKINGIIENSNDENAGVITTNLTPEEIQIIQALPEGGEIPAELKEKVIFAFITIAPETGQTAKDISDAVSDDPTIQNVLAILLPPAPKQNSASSGESGIGLLASRLNNLNVGGTPPAAAGDEALFDIKEFEGSLKNLEGKLKDGKGAEQSGFEKALQQSGKNGGDAGFNNSALPNGLIPIGGGLVTPFELSQGFLEEYGLNTASTSPSTLGTLGSLVTQANSATHAHPAVQMVAVNIQKMANSGEGKMLALQLDPPELGRVEVRMSFGKDKSIKAVMTAEKPETFMMLQRDVQTLERMLQDMGLDADGGLSFELAEHGFEFDQNNQRGGGHDEGGTGAGKDGAEPDDIIETTMTWHIDPDNGHTRYDILA